MSEMQNSLNNFYKSLQSVEETLAKYKNEATSRTDQVFTILRETDKELTRQAQIKDGASGLQKQIDESLKMLKNSIGACGKILEEKSRIRAELENVDKESRAIVIVFGRTNAGKSTLGNFLRGKSLCAASFDNPWKNGAIKPGPITVIETAEEDGKDKVKNPEEFKEGEKETTKEIQCFTLPGLLWVDTPGIGSVSDEKLGNMARKYANNADLVIYLDHSDNPGLSSISKNIIKLLQNGQETVIVINQSDKTERMTDSNGKTIMENGRPKKKRIPKTEEDRRAQENQEIKSLRDMGFKQDANLSALSISMLLAKQAVEKDDDELYKGSAFGKFLERLQGVFKSPQKISKIMSQHLYTACIELCNMCLEGPENNVPGLKQQMEGQQAFLQGIKKQDENFDLEAEVSAIATRIKLDIDPDVRKVLNELEAKGQSAKSKKVPVNLNPLIEKIQRQCNELVSEKITSIVKNLFDSVEFKNIVLEARQFADFSLERKTETHEYKVPKAYRYEREPEGIKETVFSWFGKKYYGVRREMETKKLEIDLGYNLEETQGHINSMLAKLIPEIVSASLKDAKRQTLDYAQEKVEDSIVVLKKAERQIGLIKSDLEKAIRKSGTE